MTDQATVLAPPKGNWCWRLLAGILILGSAALRLLYLANDCPLDLSPDEAHYWDWSRHLDWSYYSKGPLVAYIIRLSCELFGTWSVALTGTEMFAVRVPAVLCGGLLLASLYVLTVQVTGREKLALAVVALALTLPLIAAGSALMTIDAPYTCCWGWALVLGYHAAFHQARWAWPLTGLVVGLGILAKYTMFLWLPSFALFLLAIPEQRRLLARPGFWTMVTVAGACCVPILIWNAQHDWVTFRHVGGQAGLSQNSATIHWLGPIAFAGTQFALLLGFWFVVWLRAMVACAPWRRTEPARAYLWWLSAPTFCFFLLFGLRTGGGQPNWPAATYISGLVLAVIWLVGEFPTLSIWSKRIYGGALAATCLLGVGLTLFVHQSAWAYPVLARLSGPPTPEQPTPLRRWDPTCRLRGWRTLAAEVDRLREELARQGVDPVVAAAVWNHPGQLGFYCQGHPTVYSLGLALGGRHSQYDFWRPNPLDDADRFAGRTFIFVGGDSPLLAEAFTRLEPPRLIEHRDAGQPVAQWIIVVGHGFRGFPRGTKGNSPQPY